MAAWESDEETSSAPSAPAPAPAPAPAHKRRPRSSRSLSRSPSRLHRPDGSRTLPSPSSSPPPTMPPERADRKAKPFLGEHKEPLADHQKLSLLDPSRFTPSLHASLVSEILTLRRDQEHKTSFIDGLEAALHESREQHESVKATYSQLAKENRSLNRQLALLEGGTSSALAELSRERDEAVDAFTETKRRLENAQNKVRAQEEDSVRVHQLWAKERDEREEERRRFERKLHAADCRMKAMLQDVADLQASQQSDKVESDADNKWPERDGGSMRGISRADSVRRGCTTPAMANMTSLADELKSDGEEDDQTDTADGRESVLSNGHGRESVMSSLRGGRDSVLSNQSRLHKRNYSRESIMSRSHFRNTSTESQMRPDSVARTRLLCTQIAFERLEGGIVEDDETGSAPKVEYADRGTQYSAPPSPKMAPARLGGDIEANQSRKRVQSASSQSQSQPQLQPQPQPQPQAGPSLIELPAASKLMVSVGSQTMDEPMTPPRAPRATEAELDLEPAMETKPAAVQMTCSATQTDDAAPAETASKEVEVEVEVEGKEKEKGKGKGKGKGEGEGEEDSWLIPIISVQPPGSRSATPQQCRLPQYSKDVGCQVSLPWPELQREVTSAAVQTEEMVRLDQRLMMLPAHLQPCAIMSRPSTPEADATEKRDNVSPLPEKLPPRNPRRLTNRRSGLLSHYCRELSSSPPTSPQSSHGGTQELCPGNKADGPSSDQNVPARRPHRISTLFAGFDALSSDEGDELNGFDLSDAEFCTALSAPIPRSQAWRLHRDEADTNKPVLSDLGLPAIKTSRQTLAGSGDDETRKLQPPAKMLSRSAEVPTIREGAMRKSAITQGGPPRRGRARPKPETRPDPPFPIPVRASSRNPLATASDHGYGSAHVSPAQSYRFGPGPRGDGPQRTRSVRRARSSAPFLRSQRPTRQASVSPPPPGATAETHAVPLPGRQPHQRHRPDTSSTTAKTEATNTQSVTSSQQATSVVDAIAQTMVGEWMYKYVRRRKSFGGSDAKRGETGKERHKRWVWLAPYERSILWSSKQPSSGSALLGRSGRKLVIQSVLDVKDDNPPPRGLIQTFDRSILVLTTERALKFTATTAERHNLWLTSLSFLAHSSHAVPVMQPRVPDVAPIQRVPISKRSTVRDSIALSKRDKRGLTATSPASSGPWGKGQLEEEPFSTPTVPSRAHQRDPSRDTAMPPPIPRYGDNFATRGHSRQRSNTGGPTYASPSSFRTYQSASAGHDSSSYRVRSSSGAMSGSENNIPYSPAYSPGSPWARSATAASGRASECSTRPASNFFEAIGTVRMEAFITPLAFPRFTDYPDELEEKHYMGQQQQIQDDHRPINPHDNQRQERRRSSAYSQMTDDSSREPAAANNMMLEPLPGTNFLSRDPFGGF